MPQFKHWLAVSVSATAMCAGLGTAALAQTASPTSASQGNVAEVVVTALKVSQSAEATPIALTVVSGDNLQERGVVAVADLQNLVPGVTIGRDGFGVNINIRGVTTTDTTSKGDQGIAFNLDGVTIGRPREQGLAFFDVDRVEVLRGPQGTLYGKSTTGGVINVVTKRPTWKLGGTIDGELGNFDTRRLTAVVNAPINDVLAVRAAVTGNRRDGWLSLSGGSKAKNDQDDLALRLGALFKPSDTVSLFVTGTTGRVRGVGPGQVPAGNLLTKSGKAQRQGFGNPFGGAVHEDFSNITADFSAELGAAAVNYVGGYRRYKANSITSSTNDPAGNNPGPAYNWVQYRGKAATKSHELRLSNAAPGKLNWIAGYNWYREDLSESDHNWSARVTNPTLAGSTNGIDPLNSTDHASQGVFGQATYAVTDELNITAGARYSKDKVVRVGTFAPGPGPWKDPTGAPCVAPNDCVGFPNNGYQSDGKTTYRLGFDYHFAERSMVFGSVATGYKAGGFNDFEPSTGGVGAYDPETLTAYEVGYKGRPTPTLSLSSSIYIYDYKGSQISSLVNISGNMVIYTRLVPTKIKGWENEFTWTPTAHDKITGSLTLADSEYVKFNAGLLRNVNWDGYSLDKVPDITAQASYAHDWDLANGGMITAQIASRYNSGYLVSNFVAAIQIKQGNFTRTDATLTYRAPEDRYKVSLFVKNIEDELQILGAPGTYNSANLNLGSAAASEPRMYGIRFGAEF